MTNTAIALAFKGRDVRIVLLEGEPWWVLADVCAVFEHSNSRMVADTLDPDEKGVSIIDTLGGPQRMTVVSEPGLYKIIMTSRKPVAREFDRWVRHEVLPQIRRTGAYGSAPMPTLDEIGDLFATTLAPVHRDIAEIKAGQAKHSLEIQDVRGNVTFLANRVNDIVPRRNFSADTRRHWAVVVERYYGGRCPCCSVAKIVANSQEVDAHADHFNGRERNGTSDGWLVCAKCNQKLSHDARFKESRRNEFGAFQNKSAETASTKCHSGRPSKTIPSEFQGNLFEDCK